mmetsp:Transcript_31886/g.75900  ORF Transcript_31886/g.75900 Transcript_31886/m.75900 type:complete len:124 (-) Transcript_31886:218-589(-)
MMLRIVLAVASVLSCSALVMPMHTPRTVASFSSARTSPVNMGFEDSLAGMIDGVSAFFAKGGDKKAPTAAEIEEYCRDPDSSGCTLEMMDTLMAEAAKLKKAQPAGEPIRWSAEIDAAVAKAD